MKPWVALYSMIWLVLLEFLLAMTRGAPSWLIYVHVALGVGIALLAFLNYANVRATAVPGRVKRTAQSTTQLGVAVALLGALLLFRVGADWTLLFGVTVYAIVLFVHVVLAFAIITQAAAVAIAFDMWEEKEFLEETAPGDVPAMPQPGKAPRAARKA